MRSYLYKIVEIVAEIHNKLLQINDSYENSLTDKQLHFLVIGIIGMILVLFIYPVFKALANSGHTMVITWIYVFTLLVVLSFSIEIGQGITGTGEMEFADIMSGLLGFLFMFLVFSILRLVLSLIIKLIRHLREKDFSQDLYN